MKFSIIPFEETDILKLGLTSEENQAILKIKPEHYSDYELCDIHYGYFEDRSWGPEKNNFYLQPFSNL